MSEEKLKPNECVQDECIQDECVNEEALNYENEIINLKAELENKTKEFDALKDSFLRANADFENIKKRLEKEKLSAVEFAQEGFLKELLPVLDALENASNFEADDEFSKKLLEGISLTLDLFKNMLKKHSIVEINPNIGDEFNPEIHEAMMFSEVEGMPSQQIAAVFAKGYLLKDRTIRACKVSVSK
ncbi:nucleotide exchange factor GrpE [Campylobacter canadensis]|uniref:nucleotide exchange factor GrpE n=1 Tax=Campylobacter canadensis TaxID=449520 RepID=UPI001CCB75E0|nr:nucleotide exchange factor GrpE [Campylobacter canadensis]